MADCRELGWPHEWNPLDTLDDCVLCGDGLHPADDFRRYGCGYAHDDCVEPPEPEPEGEPLLWEGD